MSNSKSKLKIALGYAKRGWAVIPAYDVRDGQCTCSKGVDCTRPGKHPLTRHGVKDATTNLKVICKWWKKHPHANIAVATGSVSGITVFDVDPRNGGNDSMASATMELGKLPLTPKSKTGNGGTHYIMAYPKVGVGSHTAGKLLGSGLDVLSDGSYFVAPRSTGVGGNYAWVKGKSVDDLTPAKLPAPWLLRLRSAASAKSKTLPTAIGAIAEGHRNNHLTSVAGSLHRAGISTDAMLAALMAENVKCCCPPLPTLEVEAIVKSVTSYPGGTGVGQANDPALQLVHAVLHQYFSDGDHLLVDQARFWFYDVTHWRPAADNWVKNKILSVIKQQGVKGGSTTASLLTQCIQLLHAHLATNDDPLGNISDPKPVINTINGELWIGDDGKVDLRPHRPDSYLRHCLNIVYDPAASCPLYDAAVKGIFSQGEKPKAMIRHWNELLGYIIQPRRNIPMIVIAIGRGGNGKTKLMTTVCKLLGDHLVSAQQIGNFDGNRFAMSSLYGKHILLDDDVAAGARLPDGFLKIVSEAKTVSAEAKYGAVFNFQIRAVPVLLCNNVPSLADISEGMRRRLMVIPFDKSFKGKHKDMTLFEKIWETEMPGVLNRAIEGLARLRERGSHLKLPKDVVEATDKFLRAANPLPAFIEECCMKENSPSVYFNALYDAYVRYCDDCGITMKQQKGRLKQNLIQLGYEFSRGNKGAKVLGLRLK